MYLCTYHLKCPRNCFGICIKTTALILPNYKLIARKRVNIKYNSTTLHNNFSHETYVLSIYSSLGHAMHRVPSRRLHPLLLLLLLLPFQFITASAVVVVAVQKCTSVVAFPLQGKLNNHPQ